MTAVAGVSTVNVTPRVAAVVVRGSCTSRMTRAKLIACARLCGITTVRLCDLPIPKSARQHKLDLEPHDELPEIKDDEIDDSSGEETPKP